MRNGLPCFFGAVCLALTLTGCGAPEPTQTPAPTATAGEPDRTVLPIAEPKPPTYKELDARNAKPPPRFEVKAPKGAPNVVIVLIDDIGFGGPSTFGGPIRTPTMDRLAAGRPALQQLPHHGAVLADAQRAEDRSQPPHRQYRLDHGELDGVPGQHRSDPNSVAPLAEMLRLNGYSTGAFGKWHETAAWETSVSGPFDRWPTHQGFDKFYGFIGGETDQWYPLIYDGVIKVDPPKMKDYHFTVDMTNQAINWVKAQQSMTPDKPFFVYYATGAVHAPHHVPKEWADKYKGQFDKGWDQVRTETLERQKKLGVVPAEHAAGADGRRTSRRGTRCPQTNGACSRVRPRCSRDSWSRPTHEIGRFEKALEDIGELDNTLFIYIAGDNGTSAEGGFVGMYNEMTYFNGVTEKVEDLIPLIDKWGGPETFPHMAAGWAVAFDTPFSWTKQVASDFGGTRNGMVIHWPKGIKEKGGLRSQFSHVIDIAPTILEAAGLPQPKSVNGIGADADRRHQHALRLQRCEGAGAAQDAVLRDVRQSRDLQRRLARPDHSPRAVADQRPAAADHRRLGSLRREERFQPDQEPGRRAAREAEGDAGAVHDRKPRSTTCCRSTTGPSSA